MEEESGGCDAFTEREKKFMRLALEEVSEWQTAHGEEQENTHVTSARVRMPLCCMLLVVRSGFAGRVTA